MRTIYFYFLLLFFPLAAPATIYLAAFDPKTGEIGMAYSSSGAHFWQTIVKGKGMVGAQASGLCDEATPQDFLEAGWTARRVVDGIYKQCHDVGWESYRVLSITLDGSIEWAFGAEGCTANNEVCGPRQSENFVVTGGGLEKDVLEAAVATFNKQDQDLPLACRLLNTLDGVYAAGGEKKEFAGASITIDDPKQMEVQNWSEIGKEDTLLPSLDNQMKQSGVICPR